MLLQALENVEIEALPRDLPSNIDIDISNLTQEEPITVADLPVLDGVEYLTDSEETVFTIVHTREESDLDELDEPSEPEAGVEPEIIAEMDGDEEGEASDEENAESEA